MLRSVLIILLTSWLSFARAADSTGIKSVPAFAKLFLSTNSYFYQPGAPVYFTSFLLESGSLEPVDLTHNINIRVLDSRLTSVYNQTYSSSQGLVSAAIDKHILMAGGEYTIIASVKLNRQVYESRRKIVIQDQVKGTMYLEIKPDKEQYSPGDSLHVAFHARLINGDPVMHTDLSVIEVYQGSPIDTLTIRTGRDGSATLHKKINPAYDANDLVLYAGISYLDFSYSQTERIKLNAGSVDIQAFLEDGRYNTESTNRIVLLCANEKGALLEHHFRILNTATADTLPIVTNAYGLAVLEIAKGQDPNKLLILADDDSHRQMRIDLETDTSTVLSVRRKERDRILYSIFSPHDQDVTFMAHVRGQDMVKKTLHLRQGQNTFSLDLKHFRQGILQALVLDDHYAVLCEKLNYVNRYKTLQVTLDKYTLNCNEYSHIGIEVKDYNGDPVSARLAVSITDEAGYLAVKDRQSGIEESVFFESELDYPVADIGKLFQNGNDSLVDIFLASCTFRNPYWKKILQDAVPGVSGVYYRFQLQLRYRGSEKNYDNIESLSFISGKGCFHTTADSSGFVYIPVDKLEFPLRCVIHTRRHREAHRLSSNNADVVYRLDSVLRIGALPTDVIKLRNYARKSIKLILQPPAPAPAAHTPIQHPSPGQTTPENMTYVACCRVVPIRYTSLSRDQTSNTFTLFLGYKLSKTGIRSLTTLGSYVSGTTLTNTGISNRGSRPDGNAYYIDGVRLLDPNLAISIGDRAYKLAGNINALRIPSPILSMPTMNFSSVNVNVGNYSSGWVGEERVSYNFVFREFSDYRFVYKSDYRYDLWQSGSEADDNGVYYYKSAVTTDSRGKAEITIMPPSQALAWHISITGTGARSCKQTDTTVGVRRALYMVLKAPNVLRTNDSAKAELHVVNDNDDSARVELIDCSTGDSISRSILLMAHSSQVITASIHATGASQKLAYMLMKQGKLELRLNKEIPVLDHLYHNEQSFELDSQGTVVFNISPKSSSYQVSVKNPLSLVRQMESYLLTMLREPHGCFEQVSTTNYPNILAYQLLDIFGHNQDALAGKREYLVSGYKQLVKYETNTGGFSWFGNGSGNEALTAMGLLQFSKLSACHVEVDRKMVDRTTEWLKSKQSGHYFIQSQGKYGFSNVAPEVAHAYITFVLTELGDQTLDKEIAHIKRDISQKPNPYTMSLLCAILARRQRFAECSAYVRQLSEFFQKFRSNVPATSHLRSLVNSGPRSASHETLAILATAIYKNRITSEYPLASSICNYLKKQDKYSWGNMQTMAFILESFASQILAQPEENSDQALDLTYILNGKKNSITLLPGETYTFDTSKQGANTLTVRYSGNGNIEVNIKEASVVPYITPQACALSLRAEFSTAQPHKGSMAFYNLSLSNKTNSVLPQSVAAIAIPGGMNINPEELLFLTAEKKCDFYEIHDQVLYLYWEEINAAENISISLPFTCEIEGSFSQAACYVYNYYQPERKTFYIPAPLVIR